uniref:Integrin_alpha2 domain-containing protein n=1 Tax=Heterorhabditis bacteriophora TaxID=37862 RepID=A0A1I7XK11_HETBA
MSSSTMEATQLKVKTAVDEMINEIDRKHLRDMQKNMFLCSAKCCENKNSSRELVENCVEKCNIGMKNAQRTLEKELGGLQDQLSRCAMTCYDRQVQNFGPDVNKYTEEQVSTKREDGYHHSIWISSSLGDSFTENFLTVLGSQAMTMDVDGNGWHDVLGFYSNGSMFCMTFDREGKMNEDCAVAFSYFVFNDRVNSDIILIKFSTGDHLSEIIFMGTLKTDSGSYLNMQMWGRFKGGWRETPTEIGPVPGDHQFVGAPIAADFDADGWIELLVPVCRKKDCAQINELANWQKNRGWTTNAIIMQVFCCFYNKVFKYCFLLIYSQNMIFRKFEMNKSVFIQPKEVALSDIKMTSFFDLKEDGSLDILVEYIYDKQTKFRYVLYNIYPMLYYRHSHNYVVLGSGVSWGGACAMFSMSDGWGGSLKSSSCQISATTHRSLMAPYVLFGLGRSPNFVDKLIIGAPRYAENLAFRQHTLKQIVPNSRIIVMPPSEGTHWQSRLYVTPSQLILQIVEKEMADESLEASLRNVIEQSSLKWIFVGGKGGVGKTTCSFFVLFFCGIAAMGRELFQNMIGGLPGIDEAMSFSEMLKLINSMDFDVVVFDTAPTGHTLRLLQFPSIIERAFSKIISLQSSLGPMVGQVSNMLGMGELSVDDTMKKLNDTLEQVKKMNTQFKDPVCSVLYQGVFISTMMILNLKIFNLNTIYIIICRNSQHLFVFVSLNFYLSMRRKGSYRNLLNRLYEDYYLLLVRIYFSFHIIFVQGIDTHNIIVNQLLFPSDNDGCVQCKKCQARYRIQSKYLEQIADLYEDFHVTKLPLLDDEVRGSEQLRQFSENLFTPYAPPH